jgi:hypothetical protein
MKKKLIVLSGFVLTLAPVAQVLAQQTGTFNSCTGIGLGTIEGIVCKIGNILNVVVPVLIVLAVIYFIWGVITYVIGGDEEAKKKGRDKIIFGIIGLAVIIAVWGLVKILTNTFGINTTTGESIVFPTVPY